MNYFASVCTLTILLLNAHFSKGQSQIKESLEFTSEVLNKKTKYSIYLPDGYETSSRLYPVLYLLHGYSYNENSWIQYGQIQEVVDRCITQNETSKVIVVMPDGGNSWYQNDLEGKARYEDYFVNELIPFIESQYRARPEKQFRAIAGFSMGGWGALLLAMKHYNLFSSVAGINAAIYKDEQIASDNLDQKRYDEAFGHLYGLGLKGMDRINSKYKNNAPIHLLSSLSAEDLKKIRYFIDCADDDFLIPGNMQFHEIMRNKKIVHEFRVRDGDHSWQYWREAMPEVLKFIDIDFTRS